MHIFVVRSRLKLTGKSITCTQVSRSIDNYLRAVYSDTTQLNSTELNWTQLNSTEFNWTQLAQLNSVQPSQSRFCLWLHDLQTESTVVHAVELSSVEFSWVELSCVAINTPLDDWHGPDRRIACRCPAERRRHRRGTTALRPASDLDTVAGIHTPPAQRSASLPPSTVTTRTNHNG